ncbi:4-hydroxybenzoate polyprenyl transferase, partial [Dacryopinax primogenitus]
LPQCLTPYLLLTRLDKPTGTLLLLLPCTWSITLASSVLSLPPSVPIWYMALFGLGAFIMRGAGCTVNDMWDHRLDRLVERTRTRPLASNLLSLPQASLFLSLQLLAGLSILLQLNTPSILLGALSLPFVALYPVFKRLTYWPQAFLGLTFNWGALLGWAAVSSPPDWAIAGSLYAAGWCWTIVYDTIYAHQDKSDDTAAGIKSTALLFNTHTTPILTLFSGGMLASLSLAGYLASCTWAYYAGLAGAGWGLARIVRGTDWQSRESCWEGFRGNVWVGTAVMAGVWADY